MPMKIQVSILALLLGCAALSVEAKPPHKQQERGNDERVAQEQDDAVSLDRAAAQVRRNTRGRVLSADTEKHNGDRVHRIKVLTPEGRVRVINVDEHDKGDR